jgi:hypothetical protein
VTKPVKVKGIPLKVEDGWTIDWNLLHYLKELNKYGDLVEEQIEDIILDLIRLNYYTKENTHEI